MLKKITILIASALLLLSIGGCRKSPKVAKVEGKAVYHAVTKIYIDSNVPVDSKIAQNIQSECALGSRLVANIDKVARAQNIDVVLDGKAKGKENTLKLKIIDAISTGSAFTGHRKYVVASGDLYEGKKKVASFKSARLSGGGMFGGYKSSCAVLGGCTTTMAKDIVKWLKSPTENAMLGDTHLIK